MKATPLIASCLALLSKALFLIGGLSFFFGGRALAEFAKVDRLLAEMAGIALAFVFVLLGFGLRSFSEKLTEADGNLTIINRD